jgi:chaperone BCS1
MTDGALLHALATSPPKTLIVIEDVDCIFKDRDTEKGVGITFSGFLNALDGVASAEGCILVMTTNHKDKLDPALIRPGRIDVEIEFHDATASQAVQLFDRFYPNTEGGTEFGQNLPTDISMAQLQGHLIVHKDDPQAAISSLSTLGATNESAKKQTQTSTG